MELLRAPVSNQLKADEDELGFDMKKINTGTNVKRNSRSFAMNDKNKELESNTTLSECQRKRTITYGHHCDTMENEYVTRLFCLQVLLPAILTFGTVGNMHHHASQ